MVLALRRARRCCRRGCPRACAERAGRLAERRGDHPRPRRGRRDCSHRRLAPEAGLSRAIFRGRGGRSELGWHGSVASAAANAANAGDRLEIVTGNGPPPGWTGKLSAMRQGLAEVEAGAQAPEFVLFTDADIAYAPHVLSRLVAIARANKSVLTSLMVKLRCESAAERWLAPAFVFFFQMLYPFAWVNDPRRTTAAAAGGCMLVRREALQSGGRSRGRAGRPYRRLRAGRAHEEAGTNLAWPDRQRG